jgi:hypothetical protein
MKKPTIFFAIAFGTSVRDVLRNDTYKNLKNNKKLNIVILARHIDKEFKSEFGGKNIYFEQLVEYKASLIERCLGLLQRGVLRHKCRTIDLGNTAGNTLSIDIIKPFTWVMLKIFGLEKINKLIHFLYKKLTPAKLYIEVFEKYKPSQVIVTRVLNFSDDYPVMRTALKFNVPVIALVSSWDNLTSKAFFPFSLDKLVVWNVVMKNEAIDLFQYPESDIFSSGIPRYDALLNNKLWKTKEKFFESVGAKSNKKLITYATGSKTTGRTKVDPKTPELEIVKYLAQCINTNKISNSQLLVRLHPQANSEEYKILLNIENVILQVPGRRSSFQDRLFSCSDDIELGELMKYSDVVINMASTITIDAALFDTPIICINFDFFGKRELKYSAKKFYLFDHYAKLAQTNGFTLANSLDDMISKISYLLDNPDYLKKERLDIVKQQCIYTDGKSGARIARFLLNAIK